MKRFTETEKWRDPWFRKLAADTKLAFLYIVDACDCAGVWDPDMEHVEYSIKMKVDWEAFKKAFGDRLFILPNGKWYFTRFISMQYGMLSRDCRPHAKVISTLASHGIEFIEAQGFITVPIPFTKGSGRDKEKEEDKERGSGGSDCFELRSAPASKSATQRPRDVLLDAIVEACGGDPAQTTKPAWATAATALSAIKAVCPGVTREELLARAAVYVRKHRDWTLTPSSLAKWWADCAPAKPKQVPVGLPEPAGWRERFADSVHAKTPWGQIDGVAQAFISHQMQKSA